MILYVINPLNITDFYDVDNTLILAKSSELYFGENLNVVRQTRFFLFPEVGKQTLLMALRMGL